MNLLAPTNKNRGLRQILWESLQIRTGGHPPRMQTLIAETKCKGGPIACNLPRVGRADARRSTRTDLELCGSALRRRNLLQCLNGDLFVAAFDADNHLILIPNLHFQLHRVVLLHDRPGGADAGIQQALEPLIAIGRKVQNAIVGCDCSARSTNQEPKYKENRNGYS